MGLSAAIWAKPLPETPPLAPAFRPERQATQTALPAQGVSQHRFLLQPGWNSVSFPFIEVQGTQGFEFGLFEPTGDGGKVVPVARPQGGRGYWAYAERPGQALAWGRPQVAATALALQPGWNFVGSPYSVPVALSQLTLGDGQLVNRIWEEAVPRWVFSKAFTESLPGKWQEIGLEYPGTAEFEPGRAYWIRAEKGLTLRFNAESEIPRIERFTRSPEGLWVVEGANFGSRESSRVVFDNHIVSDLEIREWSQERITMVIPPALVPHQVAIVSGGAASGRIPRSLWKETSPRESGLQIRVINEAQEPVEGAQVHLDGYLTKKSDRRGFVWFSGVEAGQHKVRIRRPGYLVLDTHLRMPAGKSHRTTATLYSPRSSLSVRAFPCDDDFRPVRIELYQKTDFRVRWLNTWYYEQATPFVELDWNSIPSNVVYRIEVTWQDPQGMERLLRVERRLGHYGLQENFFNFWSHY